MDQDSFKKASYFYDQCLNGQSEFVGIDLSQTNLDRLLLSQKCNFKNSSFHKASLVRSALIGCNFESADFSEADLTGANFQDSNMQGANLKGAILTGANFNGAIYDFSTQFDDGVAPKHLGMISQAELRVGKQSPRPVQSSKNNKLSKNSPEPQFKEVMYRGVRTMVEVEPPNQGDAKARYYRGVQY